MRVINKLLNLEEFKEKPPVLLDIGASGFLNPIWDKIAPYSIYIGFDADNREIADIKNKQSKFRGFHIIEDILAEREGESIFYYTKSPQCSSTLLPDDRKLKDWSFSDIFKVEKTIKLKTTTLLSIFERYSIEYIDWFKTDSQGTDLRLFTSLGEKHISNLIIAEFEPGIMDAYEGEDKMHAVMRYMEEHPFWLSDLNIKGPQRISNENLNKYFTRQEIRIFPYIHKSSAFWGEMVYVNTFVDENKLNKRDLLLGWLFSTLIRQHGFALELAQIGKSKFEAPLFDSLKSYSIRYIKQNYWRFPFYLISAIYGKLSQRMFLY